MHSLDPEQIEQTGLTDSAKPVHGHGLESPAHHRELLQHRVEVVHAERVEATVGVSPDAGCSPASGQQADLCKG